MDIEAVISELREELGRLDQAIEVFEQLAEGKERRRKRAKSGALREADDSGEEPGERSASSR
jgi:hypothetical protein